MTLKLLRRAAAPVASVTFLLLLVPLVAMRFTTEVNWSPGDFVVAGALIFTAGMALVVGTARARTHACRAAVAAGVVAVFLAIWAQLAVGLFG